MKEMKIVLIQNQLEIVTTKNNKKTQFINALCPNGWRALLEMKGHLLCIYIDLYSFLLF